LAEDHAALALVSRSASISCSFSIVVVGSWALVMTLGHDQLEKIGHRISHAEASLHEPYQGCWMAATLSLATAKNADGMACFGVKKLIG
jgi:hypothetical protein